MTKKDKRDYEGPLYAPHPDINVTCHIDDEEVDCKTWGEIISKKEGTL